jgi:hypothetical protein
VDSAGTSLEVMKDLQHVFFFFFFFFLNLFKLRLLACQVYSARVVCCVGNKDNLGKVACLPAAVRAVRASTYWQGVINSLVDLMPAGQPWWDVEAAHSPGAWLRLICVQVLLCC